MLRAYRAAAAMLAFIVVTSASTGAEPGRDPQPRVTLAAVGDVLFARGVGKQIARHGPDYPFEETRKIIAGADIGFCNLECSLSLRGVAQHRKYQFRADPALAANLRSGGFNVVSVANNHTMDFGREAMLDTIESVRKAGIVPVGAGKDRNDALALQVIQRNGLRVGFIGYTDIGNDGVVRLDDRPTTAVVNSDELAAQVRSAKLRCDCLVVSFHWGIEYMKRPTERQRSLAHLCVDNGADAVLGHHPHVLQPTEQYKGKPILYSMGAFVWDSSLFGANKSAIYLIELGRSSARLTATLGVDIVDCRPRVRPASNARSG